MVLHAESDSAEMPINDNRIAFICDLLVVAPLAAT
jgi:hypothetical protein